MVAGIGPGTLPQPPRGDDRVARSCSAEDLERVGLHPLRREVTIADLVAIMLAHDTDHIGQMRERLGLNERP